MRSTLVTILMLMLFSGLSAQVRPDFFTEETNPTNSNFEVYSQKAGINRRASLANLRKYFGAQIIVGTAPDPSGNSESLRNKMVVVLPDSVTYFVDWNGNALLLGGGGAEVQSDLLEGTGSSLDPLGAYGFFISDVAAGIGGVPVGGLYKIQVGNKYGLPYGALRVRIE